MEIVEVADTRDARLAALFAALRDPACLGYHFPAYGRILDPVLHDEGRWLLALSDGAPVGCLPYRCKRAEYGAVVNALPFFGPNGGLLVAPGGDRGAVRSALLAAFRDVVARDDVLAAAFYTPFLEDPAEVAAVLEPDEVVPKFTQLLSLPDVEAWPAARRRNLRRARREGFALRPVAQGDLARVVAMHREHCRVANIPEKPERYFAGLVAEAVADPEGPVRFVVAVREGETVAGLVTLRGPRTGSYAVPLAFESVRPLQPGVLLLDDAMREGRAAGMQYWNFESSPSMESPVFDYKRRWGAQLSRYAVLCCYPRGRAEVEAVPYPSLRRAYPYYFVIPHGRVMGRWEEDREDREDRETDEGAEGVES